MLITRWAPVVVAGAFCGCITQASLQPLFEEGDAVAVPEVLGTWEQVADRDPVTIEIRDGESGLELRLLHEKRTTLFEVRFGRLAGETFWDLTAQALEDEEPLFTLHRWPVHSFARVRVEGDRLEVAMLSPDWTKGVLGSGSVDVAHEVVDREILLTADTADLKRFVSDHMADPDAFDAPLVFRRPAPCSEVG